MLCITKKKFVLHHTACGTARNIRRGCEGRCCLQRYPCILGCFCRFHLLMIIKLVDSRFLSENLMTSSYRLMGVMCDYLVWSFFSLILILCSLSVYPSRHTCSMDPQRYAFRGRFFRSTLSTQNIFGPTDPTTPGNLSTFNFSK